MESKEHLEEQRRLDWLNFIGMIQVNHNQSVLGFPAQDQEGVYVFPSSYLDMFGHHSDHSVVPSLGPQDMGCCKDPGLRQQGPRAKPAVLWNPGQILHTEQNLPGEKARLGVATSYNPFH